MRREGHQMTPLLSVRNLEVRYGDLVGLVRPSHGHIAWMGSEISRLPAYAVVARGLTLSPEGWRLFTSQTVEQNLRLGATPLNDKTRVPALLERVFALFPRLAERRRQRAGPL